MLETLKFQNFHWFLSLTLWGYTKSYLSILTTSYFLLIASFLKKEICGIFIVFLDKKKEMESTSAPPSSALLQKNSLTIK